jgi:hypothetical protein
MLFALSRHKHGFIFIGIQPVLMMSPSGFAHGVRQAKTGMDRSAALVHLRSECLARKASTGVAGVAATGDAD